MEHKKFSNHYLLTYLLISLFVLIISCKGKGDNVVNKLDGSEITFAEIDSIVLNVMKEANVPGLQLAVFDESKVRYMHSYGHIDSLRTIPVNNNTVIQLASLSKSIFACIVMKLVEKDQFDLDRPVYQYLDFPLYKMKNSRFDYLDLKEDERYKKITGRMLLTHTAGFKNYRNKDRLQIYFEPGSRYHYSGEGILILQGIIEHITKKDLQTLADELVFRPLKMNRTSYIWKDKFYPNASFGFKQDGSLYAERKDTVPMAAYSGVTCIADFSKLITAVLNHQLLKEGTTIAMVGPQHHIRTRNQFGNDAFTIGANTKRGVELFYGLGWGVLNTPKGSAFFKEGKNLGAQSMTVVFKNGIGLILMTNSDNGDQLFQYLNEKLIGNTYFPWKWESIYPFYANKAFNELYDHFKKGSGLDVLLDIYNAYDLKYGLDEFSADIFSALEHVFTEETIKIKIRELSNICK